MKSKVIRRNLEMQRDNPERIKLYKKIVENLKKYEIDKKNK
jgi:hypothetical protein